MIIDGLFYLVESAEKYTNITSRDTGLLGPKNYIELKLKMKCTKGKRAKITLLNILHNEHTISYYTRICVTRDLSGETNSYHPSNARVIRVGRAR